MARLLIIGGLASAAALAALIGLLWANQRRLIYYPMDPRIPPVQSVLRDTQAVVIETEDGLALGAWYRPPVDPRAATVLVCNGNAGSRADRVPLAQVLAARGLGVLLFDYRGYGGNPGVPSEAGLIRDARAARAWLETQAGVDPNRLVYLGESLGAAVAVALAAEQPPAVLVLRSPFTSMIDVGRLHYPLLPVGVLLRDRFPSIERIARIDVPLLITAGTADSTVPHSQSRRLFDAAPSAVKRFISYDGAEHNDPELISGTGLADAVIALVRKVGLTPPAGPIDGEAR